MRDMADEDRAEKFTIDRVHARLKALDRRAAFLDTRIAQRPEGDGGRTFDQAERAAIDAAILAIKLHRASLDPATSPALALAELVDALEAETWPEARDPARVMEAIDRAKKVLRGLDGDE